MHKKLPIDDQLQARRIFITIIWSLCLTCGEIVFHLIFDCTYAKNIWNWLKGILNLPYSIKSIEDCQKVLDMAWSDQAKAVIHAIISNIIHQVWYASNMARFEDRKVSWQQCVSLVKAHANIVGNSTKRSSTGAMTNFVSMKLLDINIRPNKSIRTLEVLWSPPLMGWLKCNVDGVAHGHPRRAACGGIFRDYLAKHVISFSSFLGVEDSDYICRVLCDHYGFRACKKEEF